MGGQYSYSSVYKSYGASLSPHVSFPDAGFELDLPFPIVWVRGESGTRFDLAPAVSTAAWLAGALLDAVVDMGKRNNAVYLPLLPLVLSNSEFRYELTPNTRVATGLSTSYLLYKEPGDDQRGLLIRPFIGFSWVSDFGEGKKHEHYRQVMTVHVAYDNFWNFDGPSVSRGWQIGISRSVELLGR